MCNRKNCRLSIVMALVIVITSCPFAFANDGTDVNEITSENSNTEIFYVEDDSGKIIPVEVVETTEEIIAGSNEYSINATPDQPVGATKTITINVSNEAMGLPSVAGQALSFAARKNAANIVAKAVAKKFGTKLIPGLNVASFVLSCAAIVNGVTGKDGIKVRVYFKYVKKYIQSEGHYVYGWNIVKVKVYPY